MGRAPHGGVPPGRRGAGGESDDVALRAAAPVDMEQRRQATRSVRQGLVGDALCPVCVERAMIVGTTQLLQASGALGELPMDIAQVRAVRSQVSRLSPMRVVIATRLVLSFGRRRTVCMTQFAM